MGASDANRVLSVCIPLYAFWLMSAVSLGSRLLSLHRLSQSHPVALKAQKQVLDAHIKTYIQKKLCMFIHYDTMIHRDALPLRCHRQNFGDFCRFPWTRRRHGHRGAAARGRSPLRCGRPGAAQRRSMIPFDSYCPI